MIAASKVSSSSTRSIGFLCAASTNGRVVEAYEESERSRKAGNEDVGRLCAR
jgi:hypothetical protein